MAELKGELVIRSMTVADIPSAQEVGQSSWSDIASRELGRKVSYPVRPRRIIEAYLWKEPQGCLVAELDGKVIGAAYAHVWGKVGWFGPFEVLPELQDKGVGKALLRGCERFLGQNECQVQGLETMSNIAKNIHFYMRAGYRIDGTSLIMDRTLRSSVEGGRDLRPIGLEEAIEAKGELSSLSVRGSPLVNYSKEVEMAVRHDLGPVIVWRKNGKMRGVAVLHSYFPPEESDHASLRLLLVDPRARGQEEGFDHLMGACESWAFQHGRRRMFVRFPAMNLSLYGSFLARGFRLGAANLRMSRGGRFSERGRYHLAAWAG